MAIRRASIASLVILALLAAAGCGGQKTAQNTPATGASSDSLLASSPIEPSQAQLQPQSTVPQPTPEQTQSAPTPVP